MCDSEKLVESTYHKELLKYFPIHTLRTGCGTDGILETELSFDNHQYILKIIVETKMNETFTCASSRSAVLGQIIYYLKKMEICGEIIPNIVLVGDKDECFVLHSNFLLPYLDLTYDWHLAPSSVRHKNPQLIDSLAKDILLQQQCYVFIIDNAFKFDAVFLKIQDLATNVRTLVRITPQNISKIFDYFSMRILKRNKNGQSKYTPREQVEFFMQLIINQSECFPHPNKTNLAIFGPKRNIHVDTLTFKAFLSYYQFDYNSKSIRELTAICDRLIEDSDRRKKGDFYTPSAWADEAHKIITSHLHSNWKQEFMVWDCAWGTGNLTRDYYFKELYCSTLEEHDLTIAEQYNSNSCKFQYDFLNDDISLFESLLIQQQKGVSIYEKDFIGSKLYAKAPNLIKGLLAGRSLIFFLNPPYATNAELGNKRSGKKNKSGVALTTLHQIMTTENMGACTQQLFAQFIYRIMKFIELFSSFNSTIYLGIFSPPGFMTSSHFKSFRIKFRNFFTYIDGMLFQANNFANVSDKWGITFTFFKSFHFQPTNPTTYSETYPVSIKDINETGIYTLFTKTLYNMDGKTSGSDWVKQDIKHLKGIDAPQMTNALSIIPYPKNGKLLSNALGYYYNQSNIINENSMNVCLYSSCASHGHGISILPINFKPVISNFAARRLISGTYASWINAKDEYMVPNTIHPLYQQWENDCIVYALFNTASNQSSLRQVIYNNNSWNIFNHFFFMSKDELLDLSLGNLDSHDINHTVYNDLLLHGTEERYVYTQLKGLTLSADAEAVLNKALALVRSSFKNRNSFNLEYPEYHINTWDAGWYQIKNLLKFSDPDGLKSFNIFYKEFEDRMRSLVYELGFLHL